LPLAILAYTQQMVGTYLHPFYKILRPHYKSEVSCTRYSNISDFHYLDQILSHSLCSLANYHGDYIFGTNMSKAW